ncbi:MAG: DUF4149 domain-containing protein [Nitrospira sp.]
MGDSPTPSKGLLTCLALDWLALAVWTGGLIIIVAVVIPAVFNSFGMEPGGRFLTRTFDGYNRAVLVAMALMGGALAGRAWLTQAGEPQAQPGRAEALLFGIMVVVALAIIAWLGPESVILQEEAFAVKDDTARKIAYAAFFKVHTVVRALYILNLGLGIALMVVKLKSYVKNYL